MKNKLLRYVGALLLPSVMVLSSCEDNNTDPVNQTEMITIAEGISHSGDYSVKIMAVDSLFEGYNKLHISLFETGTQTVVNDAVMQFHPLMDMMTKVHAAPVENPVQSEQNGSYDGAIVFIMPSTDDMGWSLKLTIDDGGFRDTINLQLPKVRALDEVRKIMVVSGIDSTVYFVSLLSPMDPVVGMNDIEFAVHYKQNMMSFPAADDLTLEIEPEMPSMDHGSPNNENPVFTGNGHYKGKVNFTMTGWWRVNLVIKKGSGMVKDNAYFDITFQ
ncbi:FixH family protein [Saccharicrinis sp. FJH54]|uniref:FixH family protein n=1 Tax=Saccharicrinis sp. FJH54 TaxID=3344665 RepID=UPI0035D42CD6